MTTKEIHDFWNYVDGIALNFTCRIVIDGKEVIGHKSLEDFICRLTDYPEFESIDWRFFVYVFK